MVPLLQCNDGLKLKNKLQVASKGTAQLLLIQDYIFVPNAWIVNFLIAQAFCDPTVGHLEMKVVSSILRRISCYV